MKRVVLALLVTGLAVTWPASPAAAEPRPIDSYCSPTGDFCQGLFRERGRVKAQLSTFSFRGNIQLCVKAPRTPGDCKLFRLRSTNSGIFTSKVTLSRHFRLKKRGRYAVTWRLSGTRIGQTLHFKKS